MTFDLSVTLVRPWRFAPSLTLEAMSFVMSPRAATFSTKPPTLGAQFNGNLSDYISLA